VQLKYKKKRVYARARVCVCVCARVCVSRIERKSCTGFFPGVVR